MRLLALILLCSCAHTPRPVPVAVRVGCGDRINVGEGLAHATLVTASAALVRCADGLPRQWIEAGDTAMIIEGYTDGKVQLRRAPWVSAAVPQGLQWSDMEASGCWPLCEP